MRLFYNLYDSITGEKEQEKKDQQPKKWYRQK
jgi:hypothetical protein